MPTRRLASVALLPLLASLGLLAACTVDAPTFTGIDAADDAAPPDGDVTDGSGTDTPAGTASLTVAKAGAATGVVTSNPGGITCGTTCSAVYDVGTMVTLTATADAGAEFTGWSGGGCTGTSPCTVTMDAAKTVTATFAVPSFAVTVTLGGNGAGMVTATGIACPGMCSATVPFGTQLTLTAAPTAGSVFTGWGGACTGSGQCTVTVTAATDVTANFALNQTLIVAKTGSGSGTVTSAPTGINCGADCDQTYLAGTVVTLTAVADADSNFTGWSGGGCTETGTCVVTVTGSLQVTASFVLKQFTLTVMRTGAGAGAITSAPAGINCGADCTELYDVGTMVVLTAAPTVDSLFQGWSGGGCLGTGSCAVTIAGATTVSANFAQIVHTLNVVRAGTGSGTVTSSPAGITCGADCNQDYAQGTMVTLTATPNAGSSFTGWSGGGCAGTGTCTLTMAAATTVTASFAPVQYTLTVMAAGAGTGTVTSSPTGISCGADCTESYNAGTGVTLTAASATGSTFTGWSGGGCAGTGICAVTMNAATTVTATFALDAYTLTVAKNGTGGGTVTSAPAGITCGADCSEPYSFGTAVTLTATPVVGSTFSGWSGGGCSGTGTCTIAIAAATAVTATFTANQYLLTVAKTGAGTGTVSSAPIGVTCGADCTEAYDHGTVITLTATPTVGSTFGGWSGGGCAGTGTCVVTLTAATTVSAAFTLDPFSLTVTKSGTGAGTITSAPAGISCGADCTEPYTNGTSVTLTAAPAVGSTFTGWSGGGCTGTGTCTVSITAPITVTATFTLDSHTLSVAKAGTGSGSVASAPVGITCGADCAEVVAYGTSMTLTATPAMGSTFAGWSGGGCSGTGSCVVTVTAATTVTATFTLNTYTLTAAKAGTGAGTISSAPAGISCGADCAEPYGYNTSVTLTATPSAGSTFGGWSGGGCSGTGTCTVVMTAATTATATFTLDTYTLTVAKAGTGAGTVTSAPVGINCGADCSEVYGYGTSVVLSASPAVGSNFSGWSGGGCSGTGTCTTSITASDTVTATFVPATYTLTVAKAGTGAGTVTSAPVGINCGADCSEPYAYNTAVTLTAAALAGSTFTGWSGGGCSGTGTCTTTITSATTVTATFTLNTYTLTVALAGTGAGSVSSAPAGISCGADCSEVYGHGTSVTLTATPMAGSTFSGWSGGGCSGAGTCTTSITAAVTVTATFVPGIYTLTVAKAGTGVGTVSSAPVGISCGTDCSEPYSYNTAVTLTATAGTDSTFAGWSGGGCSGTGTCTVTVAATTTVTATFTLNLVVTIQAPAASSTTAAYVTVTFTVNQPATTSCRFDPIATTPFTACASGDSLFLPAGVHTVEVRAIDGASNTTVASRTWTVACNTPPALPSALLVLHLEEPDSAQTLANAAAAGSPAWKGTSQTAIDDQDPTGTALGRYGRGLRFVHRAGFYDPFVRWANLSLSTFASEFTVEFWAKPESTYGVMARYLGPAGSDLLSITRVNATVNTSVTDLPGGAQANASRPLSDNVWHHVVISWIDNGTTRTLTMWVDAQPTVVASPTLQIDLSGFFFGTQIDTDSDGFDGYLDEISVSNRAVTQADVNARYCPAP